MRMRRILTTCLLILSLGLLSGFSSILHSHDLDLHDDHEDCYSCEWNQVSIDQGSSQPSVELGVFEQKYSFNPHDTEHLTFSSTFLSRAPPL